MELLKMKLPSSVGYIIERLEHAGFRADVVGGAVRDFLISRPSPDYDITTSATPDEIKAVFKDIRTVDTGIRHGTVTLVIDGVGYEVTTYRIDGEYLDNRHPDGVSFTREIGLDLMRRDFTVNAIAYNARDGYTDPFGGVNDIESRIIRAVGDPYKRFEEDALRIMRAIRFSSVLGFEIEPQTARAVHECRHLLGNVSRERIFAEWVKLIAGENSYGVLSDYPDVITSAIPQLSEFVLLPQEVFEGADGCTSEILLFHGTPNSVASFSEAMRGLHSDNKRRELGKAVLTALCNGKIGERADVAHFMNRYGEDVLLKYLDVAVRLGYYSEDAASEIMMASKSVVYQISQLAISGKDIISLGFTGQKVGEILALLLEDVIQEKTENTFDALIGSVKEKYRT